MHTQTKIAQSDTKRTGSRLAALGLIAASLAVAAPIATAAPAQAAQRCTYKDVNYYPGSAISRHRYGQVEVSLKICGSNPDNWSASESHWVNGTGTALGFQFDSVRVVETDDGTRWKKWELRIDAKTCLANPGWICKTMGFKAPIKVEMETNGRYRWSHHTTTATKPGTVLYRTP